MTRYESAREIYAAAGADTERALARLAEKEISVHCWQGDDVVGFDCGLAASGGIQTTGNYPGRARTPEELMADIDLVLRLTPGKKRLNIHASYAIFENGEKADRNELEPRHFEKWADFAAERGMGLDFNPTFFSHPMAEDGLTLSSPKKEVRDFWIEHGRRCLKIAEYFARRTGSPCLVNFWMPDGLKDRPADREGPRRRMKDSLDAIFAAGCDKELVIPTLESKVFGIGVEAYTAGSAEFCLGYSLKNGITPLVDNGHYHPTETVADKISSLLLFADRIALHVTRHMRWDSDHVASFDDETRDIMCEAVRCGLDRVLIATDFFDASINRISAWVTGIRAVQKALLFALLEPEGLGRLQDCGDYTALQVRLEESRLLPLGDVWSEFLRRSGVREDYLGAVKDHEKNVLSLRKD
ncbi:MAG: L-rhamnose isomerase [Oscillospiraceae bacterium]|nr:L-rhamnose isomerase [Oscillospiraceae bacterium]